MSFVSDLSANYDDLFGKRDTRVDGWMLMSSPAPTLLLVAINLFLTLSLGPRLMKDRPPFQLGFLVILYNIGQILASLFIFYKFLVHGWLFRYSLTCQPVGDSDDPDELVMIEMMWWFFIIKLTSLADNVLSILRKHPISHSDAVERILGPVLVWSAVRFAPAGHVTFFAILNTFIQYQRYTWWKQHLPALQMVQYVAVLAHSGYLLVGEDLCPGVPKAILYLLCAYSALMATITYQEHEAAINKWIPLGDVVSTMKSFMITLTSACAMDQSALYDGQSTGHGDDYQEDGEESKKQS